MFCRSRWLSSAVVFEALFGAVGADDDLCGAGIADFGVRGFVAAWRGSLPGLAEVEPALEPCAVTRQTPAAMVTNKHTTLYFVILIVNLPPGYAVPVALQLEHVFGQKAARRVTGAR